MSESKAWSREVSELLRERQRLRTWFRDRFFSLFYASLEWEGVTEEERMFIVRTIWDEGKVGAVRCDNGFIAYTRVANIGFNLYGSPTEGQPITLNGTKFVPWKPLENGNVRATDPETGEAGIVVGFALPTRKPLGQSIEPWIDDLLETEIAIRSAVDKAKMPYAIGATPNNEKKIADLVERVMLGSRKVVVGIGELDAIKAFMTDAPYICDRLEERKDHLEKEVLTFLGIDNLKEKPERMQGDEINANNDEININQKKILGCLSDWCGRVSAAFGKNLAVRPLKVARSLYEGEEGENHEAADPME